MKKLLMVLLLLSCKTLDGFLVTAEALDVTGDDFVAAIPLMDKAYEDGKVTPLQYLGWVRFVDNFKTVYPEACRLWKIARRTFNAKDEERLSVLLTEITLELSGWIKFAKEIPDGGM